MLLSPSSSCFISNSSIRPSLCVSLYYSSLHFPILSPSALSVSPSFPLPAFHIAFRLSPFLLPSSHIATFLNPSHPPHLIPPILLPSFRPSLFLLSSLISLSPFIPPSLPTCISPLSHHPQCSSPLHPPSPIPPTFPTFPTQNLVEHWYQSDRSNFAFYQWHCRYSMAAIMVTMSRSLLHNFIVATWWNVNTVRPDFPPVPTGIGTSLVQPTAILDIRLNE